MMLAAFDLRYLEAGLGVLEDYLLSQGPLSREAQWSLGHFAAPGGILPSLTVEGLLFARQRLQGLALSPDESQRFSQLQDQIAVIHTRWRAAWGQKAARGYRQRLQLWRQYLDDLLSDPKEQFSRYPYEVRLRVMLTLLQPEADGILPTELSQLEQLDHILQARWQMGHFVWEMELQSSFPQPAYWFLYGKCACDQGIRSSQADTHLSPTFFS